VFKYKEVEIRIVAMVPDSVQDDVEHQSILREAITKLLKKAELLNRPWVKDVIISETKERPEAKP